MSQRGNGKVGNDRVGVLFRERGKEKKEGEEKVVLRLDGLLAEDREDDGLIPWPCCD